MPELKNIKFSKLDKYDNIVFIASQKTDPDNYNLLKTYSKKLSEKYDTYLPIYHNEQYKFCTVRFFKSNVFKPQEDCFYDIKFNIRVKVKNDMSYVNCYIDKMNFKSKKEFDRGDEVIL